MVASSTRFVADSVPHSRLDDVLSARRLPLTPAKAEAFPSWAAGQGEFDLLERNCQSDDALWSQLGSWDL